MNGWLRLRNGTVWRVPLTSDRGTSEYRTHDLLTYVEKRDWIAAYGPVYNETATHAYVRQSEVVAVWAD